MYVKYNIRSGIAGDLPPNNGIMRIKMRGPNTTVEVTDSVIYRVSGCGQSRSLDYRLCRIVSLAPFHVELCIVQSSLDTAGLDLVGQNVNK